jgi:hypothetical protein
MDILGQGGFGITYLANDIYLNRKVAIKEYLPIELAVREGDHSVHPVSDDRGKQFKWGLDRFLSEAQTLAQFEHPNIVRVHAVFEENNTGYMVMAYENGQSLQQKLEGKKTLEEAELLKILIPILGGLELVHKVGFIHRDIKPDNIFLRKDGSPVLLDFGSARQALGVQTKTLTSLVSPGYAPFEQYYSKSDQQGPWTDIYSLGATLYRAIAGVPPIDAVDRSNAILKSKGDTLVPATEIGRGNYSERFLKAIDHSLQFKEEERPQTVSGWKTEFDLPEDSIKEAVIIERKITQPGTKVLERRQQKVWSLGKVMLLGVIISVAILYFYRDEIQDYFRPTREQLEVGHQRIEKEKRLAALKQTEEENQRRKEEEQQRAEAEAQRQAAIERQREEARKQDADLAIEKYALRKQEEEKRKKEEAIQTLLSEAQEDINSLRLASPEGNNAFEKYKKVLEIDSESMKAKQGLQNIVDKYIELARHAASNGNYNNAFANLDKATSILPNEENIKSTREAIELKRKEEEKQHLAILDKKRQDEEKIMIEEQENKLDEQIKTALLADGIDLSDLSPVQKEAYIAGKKMELATKQDSEEKRTYVSNLTNKSSCLELKSLTRKITEKSRGYSSGGSLFPIARITNKCNESIWVKFNSYLKLHVPKSQQVYGREFYNWGPIYVNYEFKQSETKEIELTRNGLNDSTGDYSVNINAFVITINQYKHFLDDYDSLTFSILYQGDLSK